MINRRHFMSMTGATFAASWLAGCEKKQAIESGFPLSLQSPWINDAEFIGYFVAMAKGYYINEELSFKYLSGSPDKISDAVLAEKQCDVALTNPDGTFRAILNQGAPFKIIGAQYQKSPLGIVSLEEKNIHKPEDLIGKRLAVPEANKVTARAFLTVNNIKPSDVQFVTYAYDPAILTQDVADATIDFVTNIPYTIRLTGHKPTSFLLADFNFPMFMDTVVVREETLLEKRRELVSFLRASRLGWDENHKDINTYPEAFIRTYFKDTGRTVDNEKYFNAQQKPLIESPTGVFSMSDADIDATIETLRRIGLRATRDVFVTSLLDEI